MALGGDDQRVPAGAVAWHFLARITFFAPPTPPSLVGYIAFIEGVPGPFFDASGGMPPSETTAFFTLRATFGPAAPIPLNPGSNVEVLLIPPGTTFDVFLDETPNQDWANPDSFSDGDLIATFDESGLLSTTIPESDGSGVSYVTFSSDLIFSKRFRFNGQRIDFKKLVRNGVTINNFVRLTPVSFSPFTQAFTDSAVAIGGRLDGDSDSD